MLEDYNKMTIDVLQQGLLCKVPPLPYARVAGENGLRLSRAVFAATLKLSDNIENFRKLTEEVEMVALEHSEEELSTDKKAKLIFTQLRENQVQVLETMLGRWEQASEIRRWIKEK